MNKDKLRELLRGKIDSYERWNAVLAEAGTNFSYFKEWIGVHDSPFSYAWASLRRVNSRASLTNEQVWWMYREAARAQLGVYPSLTSVLEDMVANLRLHYHYAHLSRDDQTMVAYTSSIEDGLRDKQVKMSAGKFMRKMMFLAPDNHIQLMEASHRSELDPSFLVAHTEEEIKRVYTTMAGDSGCMRYPASNWDLPDSCHPSHAYAYAGLGVAYTEDGGVIKSRSVIYDNPDDPKDKRYVRIYGDGCLKRKLELAGYRCDNLQGAKIKAIDLHSVKPARYRAGAHYLVPYLDGAAGNQEQTDGSYGYRLKDEDCIRLINREQYDRLCALGFAAPRFKNTTPIFVVPTVPPEKLVFTCAFSGEQLNGLDHEIALFFKDGEVKKAARDKLPAEYCDTATDFDDEGERRAVWITREDLRAHTFTDNWVYGGSFLSNDRNREKLGVVHLATDKYGADRWEHQSQCVQSGESWYLRADCMVLFDASGAQTSVPAAALDELRTAHPKDYVQVAPNGSVKAVSHVRNPKLVTTLGKRRCVRGWHEIVQLADSTWDYTQNARRITVMGINVWVSTKSLVSICDVRLSDEVMGTLMKPYVDSAGGNPRGEQKIRDLESYLTTYLRAGIERHHFFQKGQMLFRGERYGDQGTLAQMRAAVNKLGTMSDEQITDMLEAHYVPYARAWEHHAKQQLKILDTAVATWQPAATAPVSDTQRQEVDNLLVTTAVHIRDERFATAA